ncbi:fucolectin-4-like [Myxocyprinus asiaticus]|uniref:fucolectin-4-like n=1 Tax=Myxocyprinus asiaticus TaxID=70543 RepID=UPI0022226559|nr:fucolectin-4-like [Myxocyprinus asiaticus]
MWMPRCLLVLLGTAVCSIQSSPPHPQENLALRGQAVQSSTYGHLVAANAIDGDKFKSCSHTAVDFNDPWWRLDLLDSYYISRVIITNRGDCCPERLDGAEILIGNSLENNGNNNPRCAVLYNITADFTGKTFVRMKFHSSADTTNPSVRNTVLNQLQSVLASRGLSDVKLSWTQLPQPLKQATEQGTCVEKYVT